MCPKLCLLRSRLEKLWHWSLLENPWQILLAYGFRRRLRVLHPAFTRTFSNKSATKSTKFWCTYLFLDFIYIFCLQNLQLDSALLFAFTTKCKNDAVKRLINTIIYQTTLGSVHSDYRTQFKVSRFCVATDYSVSSYIHIVGSIIQLYWLYMAFISYQAREKSKNKHKEPSQENAKRLVIKKTY